MSPAGTSRRSRRTRVDVAARHVAAPSSSVSTVLRFAASNLSRAALLRAQRSARDTSPRSTTNPAGLLLMMGSCESVKQRGRRLAVSSSRVVQAACSPELSSSSSSAPRKRRAAASGSSASARAASAGAYCCRPLFLLRGRVASSRMDRDGTHNTASAASEELLTDECPVRTSVSSPAHASTAHARHSRPRTEKRSVGNTHKPPVPPL
mmetsp:Transcript_1844/g.7129  ORF Transcript_1844/g.7129 Transcript_1844/m.7129 type:complete len:208 (-) Transcript_1844:221-844(-)